MDLYMQAKKKIKNEAQNWLITGVAGFIGSNLAQALLHLDQRVIGMDNFSTGCQQNIDSLLQGVNTEQAANFKFINGDIRDLQKCNECCAGVDIVLHQAALGSVPRSIKDPIATNQSNVDGFLNMLVAARDQGVNRFVYASSSSVYGDFPGLPKIESKIGSPLSPYAVSKYVNELYAKVFHDIYGLSTIGLRYFNVFGPRQDPAGAYAAVIPKWFAAFLNGETAAIYGDGETSRDFCYVDNVIQANILAACTDRTEAIGQVYNIAYSQRTTLNELFYMIRDIIAEVNPNVRNRIPSYEAPRQGDIRHSHADISKAVSLLGYNPAHSVKDGLKEATDWYIGFYK